MTNRRNRGGRCTPALRRVLAAMILLVLIVPMTGCSANDFFGAIFLTYECAANFVAADVCQNVRLSVAANQFSEAVLDCNYHHRCADICTARATLLELAAEACGNQQEQPQPGATPGEISCKAVSRVQDVVDYATTYQGCS